ncbi:MAG: poly-gamma-glutamate hydrolase family protein [Minicystis sp.]
MIRHASSCSSVALVLAMIAAPALLVAGCSAGLETVDADEHVAAEQADLSYSSITFKVATGIDDEHCQLSSTRRDAFGVTGAGIRRQLRVTAGGSEGLCTIDTAAHTDPGGDAVVLMNRVTFNKRFNLEDTDVTTSLDNGTVNNLGSATTSIANPLTYTSSIPSNNVGEYSFGASNLASLRVIYTAPHGGWIEQGTSEEVERILSLTSVTNYDNRDAAWGLKANWPDGPSPKAHRHWHITATDISEQSFGKLGTFMTNGLPYSVAFHGFASASYSFDNAAPTGHTCDESAYCTHIVVGGGEDIMFRRGVAELLNEVLPSTQRARAEGASLPSDLMGVAAGNFVNRLAAGSLGLQLEQSDVVRTDTTVRQNVADQVRSIYDCLIEPADGSASGAATGSATSADASYATSNAGSDAGTLLRCPRYIADISVNSGATHTFSGGMASCATDGGAGGSAHLDYYVMDTGLNRWRRIGGGRINYDASCNASQATGFQTPSSTGIGSYRIVVRASTSSGTAVRATAAIAL